MGISIETHYKTILGKRSDIEGELGRLPLGYISTKVIHGKTQHYLQRRVGKRVVGKYIPDDEFFSVQNGISRRAVLNEELSEINHRISELEAAAKLVDIRIYYKLLLLKDCMPMEYLTAEERKKASSFAGAMNAVEGVQSTKETQNEVAQWIAGEVSFLSVYEHTLKKYGFPTEGR